MNGFTQYLAKCGLRELRAVGLDTVQVNVGLRCNQRCVHCHLESSPERAEMMDLDVMDDILDAVRRAGARLVDITGGAPELNPHLRWFVERLCELGAAVQVRTNLAVLCVPGMEDLPTFYRRCGVSLVGSLPCYLEENVDNQRGQGAYGKSLRAIKRLNDEGYGRERDLKLDLVYNPAGAFLPPRQDELEQTYKEELLGRFDVVFTRLLTITNMPLGRFLRQLQTDGQEESYRRLLRDSFNPDTLDGLMCRRQVSVRWDGTLYDCDFNLALGLPVAEDAPRRVSEFDGGLLRMRRIVTGEHCFGCAAGCGSSCRGALV